MWSPCRCWVRAVSTNAPSCPISRQDTFLANANDVTGIAHVSVRDTYIEGDTDFGRAATVFTHTRYHLVSTRKTSGGVIFAPNTAPNFKYGFLVTQSHARTLPGP